MLKIFNKFKKIKYKNHKKGVALVIAITVMTLLLSISFSISNIVLRQIRITNINNESKPAFYTADSAIECVFYYDTVAILDPVTGEDINKDFATSIFGTTTDIYAKSQIKCGVGTGEPMGLIKTPSPDGSTIVTKFDINYGNKCSSVEVIRTEVRTRIVAKGYNTGANSSLTGCDLSELDTRRLVERGLTITY